MIGMSLMLCIWIGVWNNPAKAESSINYTGPETTAEVQALFDEYFSEYLNSMKQHYNTNGDFRQAKVKDGIMVQQVSLEGHTFFGMGYEFPLQLEGRTVGTVMVGQNWTEWEITDVSPIDDLDRELDKVVKRFPSAKGIGYIHDPNFRIRGFHLKNGTDIQFFDTHTQTVYPIEELYEQIDARRLEPDFSPSENALVPIIQVGAADEADSYWDRPLLVGVLAVAAVMSGIIVFFWLKRKKACRT